MKSSLNDKIMTKRENMMDFISSFISVLSFYTSLYHYLTVVDNTNYLMVFRLLCFSNLSFKAQTQTTTTDQWEGKMSKACMGTCSTVR